MAIRAFAAGMLLAFAATAAWSAPVDPAKSKDDAAAAADDDTDAAKAEADYERSQLALYDALVADPSPSIQILTLEVSVPSDDPTPTALRPKPADVAARAVDFAPDDAFVQWLAAKRGNYFSSRCGPTRLPETEVANLVRLEPDNAAAWHYAVALAQVKGDASALDDALSRMAAASRADDHLVDEIAAWKSAYAAHPEVVAGSPWLDEDDSDIKASEKPFLFAMERLAYHSVSANDALKEACTPDADSDRTWRRLGWCADAGRTLAEKGTSLALRASGLVMLKATGDQGEILGKAERQHDWLAANSANPLESGDAGNYSAAIGDWRDAKNEIAAIEHRLKRLGLPSTPPPEWSKAKPSSSPDEGAQAFAKVYADYMLAVFADMRESASPEARVFAALNGDFINVFASVGTKDAPKPAAAKEGDSIATLAQANASNLKIQWMVAASSHVPDDTKANAIAAVQQAEPDNAAAWALSLAHASLADPLADTLLQRMAASKRYDMHATYGAQVVLEAVRKRPMPPELVAFGQSIGAAVGDIPKESLARSVALSTAYMMSMSSADLSQACSSTNAAAGTPRRDACVAFGRVLVQHGTTMLDVGLGESILQHLDALDGADAARVRQVRWWYETMWTSARAQSMLSDDVLGYVDDYISTGQEVEALARYAAKAGKSEPPAGWTPRQSRK